jgi:hypothetical protein
MLIIEQIEGGFRLTHTANRWTYWAYPDELEVRNNGERYKETGRVVGPRLTLPSNWTLGDVVNAIIEQDRSV